MSVPRPSFRKIACLALALALGGCVVAAPPPSYPYGGYYYGYYGAPAYYYPSYPAYGSVEIFGGWGWGGHHRHW